MGRSSRSHADENRARILQVASSLFRPHGVEAVGIADVMKVAGMIQGSFYKHFPSRGALPAEACALAFEGAAENWRGVARDAATDGRNVGMNDYVGCRISTEQSTHALAHRRALLSLREKSRRRNRKQSLEFLKEFGEPLQLFGYAAIKQRYIKGFLTGDEP